MTIPDRLLLGPGPSPVAARVMDAMRAPILSHLDPDMMALLDDVRARLAWLFGAPEGAFAFAVSGTGTSGMEAAVANVTAPGARAVVVVNGYFAERLAGMLERYGASVRRVEADWGRACDPAAVQRALDDDGGADIVAVVHAETSTGVRNPVEAIAPLAAAHGALTIVDAVTSLGAVPVDTAAWGVDVCYSCTQKGLGAPSGLAPIMFSARALERRTACRSFYLDVSLLEAYWVQRKYHHTISAPLIYALREALVAIDEEGLDERIERHRRTHQALVAALPHLGLALLPPEGERLWTLNAVRVPGGVDEALVRRRLLDEHGIEIGAGLGPLAGKIWRIGLMGSGSTVLNVERLLGGLRAVVEPRP
jgi:alanine-glyoxylate transaminase / serine-glyoxylate transaminase / serine-pyruvate transaminase